MKRETMIKKGLQVAVCAALVLSVEAGSALAKGKLGGSKEEVKGDYVWTIESECTQCHEKQGKSTADDKYLASKHAALDCRYCHDYQLPEESQTDEAQKADEATDAQVEAEDAPLTLEAAHAGVHTLEVVKKNSLRNTAVPEEACLSCHQLEKIQQATADCEVLKDANGLVVNPHDLIPGEQHEGILCANCHIMHSSDPAAAYRACVSCHHAEVWECGTCHTYNANVNG